MADRGSELQQQTHRPGPWKQQNKTHKHGKHKSKGTLMNINKGRIGMKIHKGKISKDMKRTDKRNKLKQVRVNKRIEILASKRSIGSDNTPPHLVVCVPLFDGIDTSLISSLLMSACNNDTPDSCMTSLTSTIRFEITKQRFTLLFPRRDDVYEILDSAKIADTLLLVYKAGETLSQFSKLILSTCLSQGIPSTCHVVMGLDELSKKSHSEVKKYLQEEIDKRFPKEKLRSLDNCGDACNVLRFIGGQKRRPVNFRDIHPHLVAEKVQFVEDPSDLEDGGSLRVSGYIRGRSLSVNGLVLIPGLGEFQMSQIDSISDPCPLKSHSRSRCISNMETNSESTCETMDEEGKVLEVADPSKQVPLVSEVIPDAMDGEQTWPTQDELEEASQGSKTCVVKSVPKGTSKYQSAWIVDSDGEEYEEVISDDEHMEGAGQWEELESEGNDSDDESEIRSIAQSTMDTESMTNNERYDDNMDTDEEQKQLRLLRAEKEYQMFPDEVDTPLDVPARVRFQKYRGLKSFKHSPWDPKENLPLDYARIFQFDNFKRTKKRILSSLDEEGVMSGWYVTIHIKGVPKSVSTTINISERPLVIHGLLPHENKMSAVNFLIKRTPNYSQPIKSKEELIFHVGPRRFFANPLFSQHSLGDKHKYERFLPFDTVTMATVYCPISYPPSSVLVFKAIEGSHVLVASGIVHSVDPSRIICKRVFLSGHPLKVHKRSAVIRYMFFTREDIQWFKPVELKTKNGLKGHIKEPLGTHGHVKCVFDKQLKAHDTVLMPLYKRVFPKWNYNALVTHPLSWFSINDDDMM